MWYDGYGYGDLEFGYIGNGTGSTVYIDSVTVHKGMQSMRVDYDNDSHIIPPPKPPPDPNKPTIRKVFYSEAERTFDPPQDWAMCGVTALSLWFYGDLNNDSEPMYVAVEDIMGMSKLVNHPNPNAVLSEMWEEWNVDLREFSDAGVDLTNVRKMYIGVGDRDNPIPSGSGTIYFDDIRLCRPRDVAGEGTPLEATL